VSSFSTNSLVDIPFVSIVTVEIVRPLLWNVASKLLYGSLSFLEDAEEEEEEGGVEGLNDVNIVNKSDLTLPLFSITTAYPPAPAPHNDNPTCKQFEFM
jgi:hypothetical protein